METRRTQNAGSKPGTELVTGDTDRKTELLGVIFNFSYSSMKASEMIYTHSIPEDTEA